MEKYLECILDDNMCFTLGEKYKVLKTYVDEENYLCYEVLDDEGDFASFTVEPDEDGLSYKNWFKLVEGE